MSPVNAGESPAACAGRQSKRRNSRPLLLHHTNLVRMAIVRVSSHNIDICRLSAPKCHVLGCRESRSASLCVSPLSAASRWAVVHLNNVEL